MSLDLARAPGRRQAGGDGVQVPFHAVDQGVQGGQVVCEDAVHPCGQVVAAQVVHHVREVADMMCGGVEVWAGGPDLFELGSVGLGEASGVGHDPADDAPGFRCRPRLGSGRGRVLRLGAVRLFEGAEVSTDALDVAGEAVRAQFAVQLWDVVATLRPAYVQVGLVFVEDGCPVGGLDEQFVETPGAGEAPDGGVVQPQPAADRGQGLALGQQLLHRRVPLGGAGHQPPRTPEDVPSAVRQDERRFLHGRLRRPAGGGGALRDGRGRRERPADAMVMGSDRLLHCFG
jgi:hypothetical protein